jgi:hypothetical protein
VWHGKIPLLWRGARRAGWFSRQVLIERSCGRFPEFYVTTPSGFACHPSTGGEFIVPRDRSCLRLASSQFQKIEKNPKNLRKSADRKICVICGLKVLKICGLISSLSATL